MIAILTLLLHVTHSKMCVRKRAIFLVTNVVHFVSSFSLTNIEPQHYLGDECVLATLTSYSVWSNGIPTCGAFILESTVGPMNIAHHLSNVITWVHDKYKIYLTSLNGGLCGRPSSPYHKLAIVVKGPQVYEDEHIDKLLVNSPSLSCLSSTWSLLPDPTMWWVDLWALCS